MWRLAAEPHTMPFFGPDPNSVVACSRASSRVSCHESPWWLVLREVATWHTKIVHLAYMLRSSSIHNPTNRQAGYPLNLPPPQSVPAFLLPLPAIPCILWGWRGEPSGLLPH